MVNAVLAGRCPRRCVASAYNTHGVSCLPYCQGPAVYVYVAIYAPYDCGSLLSVIPVVCVYGKVPSHLGSFQKVGKLCGGRAGQATDAKEIGTGNLPLDPFGVDQADTGKESLSKGNIPHGPCA